MNYVAKQVRFRDLNEEEIYYGIALDDVIICGHCGVIVDIKDVEILDELSWVSLEEAIQGDFVPVDPAYLPDLPF